MARDGVVWKPGAAARELGIASSTLRIYSVKLVAVLSESAGRPDRRADGRPGVRVYTGGDMRLLRRAKELLARGLTYEQVVAELVAPRGDGAGGDDRGGRRSAGSPKEGLSNVLGPMQCALEQANAATAAWQRLAEERWQEVTELRARVAALEASRVEEGAWWSRLFRWRRRRRVIRHSAVVD